MDKVLIRLRHKHGLSITVEEGNNRVASCAVKSEVIMSNDARKSPNK